MSNGGSCPELGPLGDWVYNFLDFNGGSHSYLWELLFIDIESPPPTGLSVLNLDMTEPNRIPVVIEYYDHLIHGRIWQMTLLSHYMRRMGENARMQEVAALQPGHVLGGGTLHTMRYRLPRDRFSTVHMNLLSAYEDGPPLLIRAPDDVVATMMVMSGRCFPEVERALFASEAVFQRRLKVLCEAIEQHAPPQYR